MAMNTDPNIPDPDRFYEILLAAHAGLTEDESLELDSRLILLLSNQIGDLDVLAACIAAARERVLRARVPEE
jgi:hypothetical protein